MKSFHLPAGSVLLASGALLIDCRRASGLLRRLQDQQVRPEPAAWPHPALQPASSRSIKLAHPRASKAGEGKFMLNGRRLKGPATRADYDGWMAAR